MTYKEVEDDYSGLSDEAREDIAKYGGIFSKEGVGAVVEGVYRGCEMVPGFKGKGKQSSHSFEQKDGSIIKKRGFWRMDDKLERLVEEGMQVRITYLGKDGEYHNCKLEVDENPESGDEDL